MLLAPLAFTDYVALLCFGVTFNLAPSFIQHVDSVFWCVVVIAVLSSMPCSHMQVALDGRADLLNTFLERCTKSRRESHLINALDKEGFAALHYAARFNRVVITRKLLEANCSEFALVRYWYRGNILNWAELVCVWSLLYAESGTPIVYL